MTSIEQTEWKGFTVVYFYPKTRKVMMSGTTGDFCGNLTINDVRDFNIYDFSRVKFVEASTSSFLKVVAKKGEYFELEIMVEQMKELHYVHNKIVEVR